MIHLAFANDFSGFEGALALDLRAVEVIGAALYDDQHRPAKVFAVGGGTNRWPTLHRPNAAVLYRLALKSAPAGSRLLGADDEGISVS
ncbi:hypothetical protein [Cohnella sp. REN36]|uniref:hypothetical protein n=1 Tax=Cohnella sp. REN36 TaxID=2887347 RepID=UPI001D155AD1|nr:hypothetical protein [Cohnella sp. REN36]MCC3375850.1 hypothetical protein [Cohnella sp. REN36]